MRLSSATPPGHPALDMTLAGYRHQLAWLQAPPPPANKPGAPFKALPVVEDATSEPDFYSVGFSPVDVSDSPAGPSDLSSDGCSGFVFALLYDASGV